MYTKVWSESLKVFWPLGRCMSKWEDNIRMDLRETGLEAVEWFHLAQDKDRWRALVNTEMTFRQGISWIAEWPLVSWEGLCTMELITYIPSYQSVVLYN